MSQILKLTAIRYVEAIRDMANGFRESLDNTRDNFLKAVEQEAARTQETELRVMSAAMDEATQMINSRFTY